jgi:hypothetical protein
VGNVIRWRNYLLSAERTETSQQRADRLLLEFREERQLVANHARAQAHAAKL